jgi:hypothetical protein
MIGRDLNALLYPQIHRAGLIRLSLCLIITALWRGVLP